MPAHPSLQALRGKVDTFFARAIGETPESFSCQPGCSSCCQVDLSVFPVEADPIAETLGQLPESLRQAVAARRQTSAHCLFLVDDACVVYQERPIICRSQGLALQTAKDERATCPRNYPAQDLLALPDSVVLNLNTLNTLLSVLHQVYCREENVPDQRIRLADLSLPP